MRHCSSIDYHEYNSILYFTDLQMLNDKNSTELEIARAEKVDAITERVHMENKVRVRTTRTRGPTALICALVEILNRKCRSFFTPLVNHH